MEKETNHVHLRRLIGIIRLEEWQSWFNAPVLKTGVLERVPGVRIPPPPQKIKGLNRGLFLFKGVREFICDGDGVSKIFE